MCRILCAARSATWANSIFRLAATCIPARRSVGLTYRTPPAAEESIALAYRLPAQSAGCRRRRRSALAAQGMCIKSCHARPHHCCRIWRFPLPGGLSCTPEVSGLISPRVLGNANHVPLAPKPMGPATLRRRASALGDGGTGRRSPRALQSTGTQRPGRVSRRRRQISLEAVAVEPRRFSGGAERRRCARGTMRLPSITACAMPPRTGSDRASWLARAMAK